MAAVNVFGRLSDGREVTAVRLERAGRCATFINYGARLIEFRTGEGPSVAVTSDLAGFEGPERFTGPIVGPVINRIAGAIAEVDGVSLRFEANEAGRTTLHSGDAGTQTMLWRIAQLDPAHVLFEIDLSHGEGGFPGNRRLSAAYGLDEAGALTLDLTATTDAPTLMNPGHHGVWNPDGIADPLTLKLEIPSDLYLPIDASKIPVGTTKPVADTPYDHRLPCPPDPTLDHNFCFEPVFGLRARLSGQSDRVLEIHSDAPGLQAYAGGARGVALEPQLWPDAPHHPDFPSIQLRPGEVFRQQSRFILSA